MRNDKVYNTVILAALLHDIGKLQQRLTQSGYKKYHGEFSKNFVETVVCRVWENIDDFVQKDLLLNLVYFHHAHKIRENTIASREEKELMWLVSEADNLSAKERDESENEDENKNKNKNKNKKKDGEYNLYSIFSVMSAKSGDRSQYQHYVQSPLWPKFFDLDKNDTKTFNEFINEINALEPTSGRYSFWRGFNMVYNYILRLSFFLPDFTMIDFPDTSLFVHSALTSAFAGCLYKYHTSMGNLGELNNLSLSEREEQNQISKFILYKGGLSPVQKFLFDIERENPHGVAKILRGKSILMSLWTDAIAYSILWKLNLPVCNCVVKSGTNFLLLLPNTPETKKVVGEVEGRVRRFLLEKLLGKINYVSFGVEVSSSDILENFFERFKEIGKGFAEAKYRSFYKFDQMQDLSFSIYQMGKEVYDNLPEGNKFCAFCGVYWAQNNNRGWEKKSDESLENDNEYRYCFICNWAEEIGKKIPYENIISFLPSEQRTEKTIGFMEIEIGKNVKEDAYVSYYWEKDYTNRSFYKDKFYSGAIYNTFSSHLPRLGDVPEICNRCRIGETCQMKNLKDEKSILTFECISQVNNRLIIEGEKERIVGDDLLAILKMDVDNLGSVIKKNLLQEHEESSKQGKKKKILTVSRYYMFAFLLDYFFSAVVPYKISQKYPSIYIVYAGGDDLLVIGPWRSVIDLARDIREWFRGYVFNSPVMTLSGGIVFFKPKTPLKWVARLVSYALEESKGVEGKDALCILLGDELAGHNPNEYSRFVFKWHNWFDEELENVLCNCVDAGVWGRGRIYRLLLLWKQVKDVINGSEELEKYLYASHFRYIWNRDFNDEKIKKLRDRDSRLIELIEMLRKKIFPIFSTDIASVDKEKVSQFGLPLYLTLIKTRR